MVQYLALAPEQVARRKSFFESGREGGAREGAAAAEATGEGGGDGGSGGGGGGGGGGGAARAEASAALEAELRGTRALLEEDLARFRAAQELASQAARYAGDLAEI